MSVTSYFDHEEIGLTREEIRSAAMRLFAVSLAAALVLGAGVALTVFIFAAHDGIYAAPHKFAGVQMPMFADQGVASAKQSRIEFP